VEDGLVIHDHNTFTSWLTMSILLIAMGRRESGFVFIAE
jgi:hypothetical protein